MNKNTIKKMLPKKLISAIQEIRLDAASERKSYSQHGEDLIVQSLFRQIGVDKINYLDIGAHHPFFLSNTYLFYRNKNHGVCVEPDINLFDKIKKERPRDVCLNVGVGGQNSPSQADFYIMSPSTLNTFSKEDAERAENSGQKIAKTVKIPLLPINDLLNQYFKDGIDFISLDTEGFDVDIISAIDFKTYRPKVFCVETIEYSGAGLGKKILKIRELMESHGYMVYADTYINTIFIDKNIWK